MDNEYSLIQTSLIQTTQMTLTGKSIIGFAQGEPSEKIFQAVNPATGETLETEFSVISKAEVHRAAKLAGRAFLNYAGRSPAERAKFLREIASRIENLGDTLVERATAETALPAGRIQAETGRTTNQIRAFADLIEEGSWVQARIDHAQPQREPLPKPDIRSMLRPRGPVAVFGASNFPLAFSVAGGDTASALAAGCPVVVKAHPAHPGVSELIGSCIRAAAESTDMPEGVFSLLMDNGPESGQEIVRHPAIKAVGFTGSRQGGTALMQIAGERDEPIPVFAEMSSVNPVIILPKALEERGESIAEGLAASCNLGVGQFCTNPGIVFLPEGPDGDEFREQFVEKMRSTEPATMLHDGILKAYAAGIEERQQHSGVKTLFVGEVNEGNRTVLPAVFETATEPFKEDPELEEEIFGPSTTLVRYTDTTALLEAIHILEGQLTATFQHADGEMKDYAELLLALEQKAGRLVFNGFPTGVEVCPAMVHGGPYPATSDGASTSVGTQAIERFCRRVAWQDAPAHALPFPLQG